MKSVRPVLVLAAALVLSAPLFTSCATGNSAAAVSSVELQQRRALAVEAALSVGLVPVLQNNPDYIPAAQTVAATLDTVTKDTLSAEDIMAFIAAAPVREKDRPTVTAIVIGAWLAYSAVDPSSQPSALSSQLPPAAKPFLAAAARGLRSAAAAALANPKH